MYVCHVVLQVSLTDIGYAFGRDRTTVSHACNVVEDRRDDPAFDDFIASVERVVTSVFGAPGGREHE
jgi:chromosomal replication initiation ATPase DnaA